MGWIKNLITFLRADQWYYGKQPLMLGFCCTLFLVEGAGGLGVLLIIQVQLFLFLAFGYMINNVSDFQVDKRVGKEFALMDWKKNYKLLVSLLVGLTGLILAFLLLSPLELCAVAGCYILAWIYSFPPRLKENIFLGPIIGAFAQLPAPAAVVAFVLGVFSPVLLMYLCVMFLYNLRMMLVHHLQDRENDLRTDTTDTAVILGEDTTYNLIRILVSSELLMTFLLFFFLVKNGLPVYMLLVLIIPCGKLLFLYRGERSIRLDNYYYIPLADIHESWLPLLTSGAVSLTLGGSLIWSFPLALLLFFPRHLERWRLPYIRRGEKNFG